MCNKPFLFGTTPHHSLCLSYADFKSLFAHTIWSAPHTGSHTLMHVYTLCKWHSTILEYITAHTHTHTLTHTHTHKHNNANTITLSIMMIHRNTFKCNVCISERFLCTSVKQLKRQLILFSISVPCFSTHCGFPLDFCLQSSLNAYSFSQLHSTSSTLRFTCKSVWEFGNSRIMKLLLYM